MLTLNYSDTGVFEGSSNDELLDVVLAAVGLTSLDSLAAGEIAANATKSLLPSAQTRELSNIWSRIGDIALKPNKDYDQLTQDKQLKLLDFQENLLKATALTDDFTGYKEDKELLQEMVELGNVYAALDPQLEGAPEAIDAPLDLWLQTIWEGIDISKGINELDLFLDEVAEPTDLISNQRKILSTFKNLSEIEGDAFAELKLALKDPVYLRGLLEIGRYYPETQPAESEENIFYKIWDAKNSTELQSVTSSIGPDDIPYNSAIESGKLFITQVASNSNPPLQGVSAYWLPSTNTLYAPYSGEYGTYDKKMIDHPERRVIFEDLLSLQNSVGSPISQTIYLDVLAPRGAMVNTDSIIDIRNEVAKGNILQNDAPNDQDDVIHELETMLTNNQSDAKLVAWLEGTGLTYSGSIRVNPDRNNPNTINTIQGSALYQLIDENDNQVPDDPGFLQYQDQTGRVEEQTASGNVYLDLSDPNIFRILDGFVAETAARSEVDEIMLDDNFGVLYSSSKDFQQLLAMKLGSPGKISAVADMITSRIEDVRSTIDDVNEITGRDVKLSMSVQPFGFGNNLELAFAEGRDNEDEIQWDDALRVNAHNVEDWIDFGFINGTLNVQMYRTKHQDFVETFNNFVTNLEVALDSDQSLASKLPELSISITHQGAGWVRDLADLQQDVAHVSEHINPVDFPNIVSRYGDNGFEVAIFDYLDSRNLAQNAVEIVPLKDRDGTIQTFPDGTVKETLNSIEGVPYLGVV